MPQLDLTLFPPQIIWLIVSFTLLWLLMGKFALPRIGLVLEERQKRISDNLNTAESLRVDSKKEMELYEKKMFEASESARTLIANAGKQIAEEAERQNSEMSQLITKRIQDSDNSLNSAKNEAIRNISIPVRDLVAITTKKLSGIEPKSENIETVVDKIIRNYGL